jgi:hypothetical protein
LKREVIAEVGRDRAFEVHILIVFQAKIYEPWLGKL